MASGGAGITVKGEPGMLCKYEDANTLACDQSIPSGWWGGISISSWTPGRICTYVDNNTIQCTTTASGWGIDTNTWQQNTVNQDGYVTAPGVWLWRLCRKTDAGGNPERRECWWWDWSTTIVSGDVYRKLASGSIPSDQGKTTTIRSLFLKDLNYNVNIGGRDFSNYKLTVSGDQKITKQLDIGDYLYITGYATRQVYTPWRCTESFSNSPMINYKNELVIRQRTGLDCANDYFMMGARGNVWIGWESNTWDVKLAVYGHQRIYSKGSDTDEYIDLYNDKDSNGNNVSYMISKRSDMIIGLTWSYDIQGIPLPGSYLYFGRNTIWVNKNPTQSTYNPNNPASYPQGYYVPTFQVNGSVQIGSEYRITNHTTQTEDKMKCRQEIEGTIAYYSGVFYGCGKASDGKYYRRSFDTSSVNGDNLADVPSAPPQI